MSKPAQNSAALARVLSWSVVTVVPLASFLSFSVQPLANKLLLPVQGGAAPTWLGTMLYFQIALLAGYAIALWLMKQRPNLQVYVMAGLGLAAVILSRLSWVAASPYTGLGGVLLTLTLSTLPAMVLLFSISPLMHGWLHRRGQPIPYHLFAFSNAGGLVAVLMYPFTIERKIPLSEQMLVWQGLLCLLAVLVGLAGYCFMRVDAEAPKDDEAPEPLAISRILTWLGLSTLTCAGMLGATHHIAGEIGSSPIAWVGPFGAYLLSFFFIYSGYWRPSFTLFCLGWLAVSLAGFTVAKGVSNITVDGWPLFWLMSLSAAGSFYGNGLLHESRPTRRFGFFYLILAVGGVLGGLFASFIAPLIFLRPSEFLALSTVLLAYGLIRLMGTRQPLQVAVLVLVALSPVVCLALKQTQDEARPSLSLRKLRNIYGCMMLEFRPNCVILSNETTTHSSQMTADPAAHRHPTLYYTESSGVGRTIEELQKKRPSINIGAVGLGAGTLAAYARPGDTIDFWDIDPKAVGVARDFFTYVPDCKGKVNIQETDGRKGLESSGTDYDLILIDAFCGDAIPPHLLTREALSVYFRRLEKKQGYLVIHVSNRYSDLLPVVGATANTLNWATLFVSTDVAATTPTRDWDADQRNSQYLLLCRPAQLKEMISWVPTVEDNGRVKRGLVLYEPQPPGTAVVWTDDRHSALDALDLPRYLKGR